MEQELTSTILQRFGQRLSDNLGNKLSIELANGLQTSLDDIVKSVIREYESRQAQNP